jgi:hypothetical protein
VTRISLPPLSGDLIDRGVSLEEAFIGVLCVGYHLAVGRPGRVVDDLKVVVNSDPEGFPSRGLYRADLLLYRNSSFVLAA